MIKNSEAKKAAADKQFVGLDLRHGVHYEEVIKALGGYGELVTDPKDIHDAIQRAIDAPVASVVNVLTDPKIGFAF